MIKAIKKLMPTTAADREMAILCGLLVAACGLLVYLAEYIGGIQP